MPTGIPDALRERRQWVARDADKRPFCAPGKMASSTDPSSWLSYEEAVALAEREGLPGVGYVFAADDPFAGVDLDKCRDPGTGTIQPWAQRLIERLNSYTEISPSGTGVHVITRAVLPGPGKKRNRAEGGAVEAYDRARYFTVTGLHVPGTPDEITAQQSVVTDIYERLGGENGGGVTAPKAAVLALLPEDHALIEAVESSKDSTAWHRLFVAGETRPGHSGSENDHELASVLCRYTADDVVVERIMRASPLRREKWDRRGDDYLARTIAGARRKTGTVGGADEPKEAGFVDFGAVHDAPPPSVGWLVQDIWPQGARGWIAGEAKLGKSWLALELAVSVATGEPFLGKFPVRQPGPVFYLTEESNLRNLYNRLRMILLAKEIEPEQLRDKLRLLVRKRVKLTDPRWRTRIITAIDKHKPVVLFIDPLRRYHDGGENDSADLVAVLDAAAEFQDHGPAVPIVHHMRKTSEANAGARAGQQMRGSSDLHAWGDAAMYCTGTAEDKNAVVVEVELKDEEPPPTFVVGITYGEPQTVLVAGVQTEMKPARLTVREGQASQEDIKVRAIADRVLTFLAGQTERQTVTAVKSGVPGRDKMIPLALALLRREGKADMEFGERRAQLWAATSGGASAPPVDDDTTPF